MRFFSQPSSLPDYQASRAVRGKKPARRVTRGPVWSEGRVEHSDETLASGRGGKSTNKAGCDGPRAPRRSPVLTGLLVEHIDVIVITMALTEPEASVTGSLEGQPCFFP